jgi:hypothetical protein
MDGIPIACSNDRRRRSRGSEVQRALRAQLRRERASGVQDVSGRPANRSRDRPSCAGQLSPPGGGVTRALSGGGEGAANPGFSVGVTDLVGCCPVDWAGAVVADRSGDNARDASGLESLAVEGDWLARDAVVEDPGARAPTGCARAAACIEVVGATPRPCGCRSAVAGFVEFEGGVRGACELGEGATVAMPSIAALGKVGWDVDAPTLQLITATRTSPTTPPAIQTALRCMSPERMGARVNVASRHVQG